MEPREVGGFEDQSRERRLPLEVIVKGGECESEDSLPIVGFLQCPHYSIKSSTVDVIFTVLSNFPNGSGSRIVRNAGDLFNPNGGEHHNRFGDEHGGFPLLVP